MLRRGNNDGIQIVQGRLRRKTHGQRARRSKSGPGHVLSAVRHLPIPHRTAARRRPHQLPASTTRYPLSVLLVGMLDASTAAAAVVGWPTTTASPGACAASASAGPAAASAASAALAAASRGVEASDGQDGALVECIHDRAHDRRADGIPPGVTTTAKMTMPRSA